MQVLKRGGRGYEPVFFDKITLRLTNLCGGLVGVDPVKVAQETVAGLYDSIRTEEIDLNSARVAESMKLEVPDYSILAGRILASNLHKNTPSTFSECMRKVQESIHVFSPRHYQFIMENAAALDAMIIHANDYTYDYFGFKTLENAYLKKIPVYKYGPDGRVLFRGKNGITYTFNKVYTAEGCGFFAKDGEEFVTVTPISSDVICDRPQYLYLRVAIAINIGRANPLVRIAECYRSMSERLYTHATPTLFNSCDIHQQLNSCFLLGTDDSSEGIHKTLTDCGLISKRAGGIGVWQHPIRPRDSLIRGTRGKSSGLLKQLRMYNDSALCWDQGGKRLGAYAMYVEPWHGDIRTFLQMKLAHGEEKNRARDLFYALWVPDLFAKRAESGKNWSLFSEDTAPGLSDVYDGMYVCSSCGRCENAAYTKYIFTHTRAEFEAISADQFAAKMSVILGFSRENVREVPVNIDCQHTYVRRNVFTELYEHYERMGLATAVVPARDILDMICTMQRESGTPYICWKDHVNRMSNQANIGTIKSSNLCAEIMEYSSATSYASCTLASINLPQFLTNVGGNLSVDYDKLWKSTYEVVTSLDHVIDNTVFPVPECVQNAQDYRPIAVGVQGTADLFARMRIPFCSEEAAKIDLQIAETMYHAALSASCDRAAEVGSYAAFAGSPASKGILHPDLWMQNQEYFGGLLAGIDPRSSRYDWAEMAERVRGGLRNSLLLAYMPTVSTSQIFGNNESFEPFPSNVYTKTTLAGKFTIANMHMIRHLCELGLWDRSIQLKVTAANGSIQGVPEIPEDIRDIYRTVWEIPQKTLMRRAALRGAFVDQSQSLNIRLPANTNSHLRGVFFLGQKYGLKTGSYYVRTKPAASAMKTTIAEMAKMNSTHQPDDKISVTVERRSADGVVKSHTEHTFELLIPFCTGLDGEDESFVNGLCSDISENEILVTPPPTPPPQFTFTTERFDVTPMCIKEEGCTFCSS